MGMVRTHAGWRDAIHSLSSLSSQPTAPFVIFLRRGKCPSRSSRHLVARLKAGHYRLLDTQFVTDHLRIFGAVEVPRPAYHKLLDAALVGEADFGALPLKHAISGADVLRKLAESQAN